MQLAQLARAAQVVAALAALLAGLAGLGVGLLFVVLTGPEEVVPSQPFGLAWCLVAAASIVFSTAGLIRATGNDGPVQFFPALLISFALLGVLVVMFTAQPSMA